MSQSDEKSPQVAETTCEENDQVKILLDGKSIAENTFPIISLFEKWCLYKQRLHRNTSN